MCVAGLGEGTQKKEGERDGVDLSHMAQFIQVGDDGVSRVAVIAPSMVSSGRLSPLACFYIPSSTYTHISRNKADSGICCTYSSLDSGSEGQQPPLFFWLRL